MPAALMPVASATPAMAEAARRRRRPRAAARQGAAPPGHHRPKGHRRDQHRHDRVESGVKIGRSDGDPCAGDHFQCQRVEGANQHHDRCGGQQEIIEDQTAFPAEKRKILAACQLWSAQREQHQRHTDCGQKDEQDEHPARRIAGKAVNRGQQS